MNKIVGISVAFCGLIINYVSYFFGGIDNLIIILLIIMGIDYLTGICKAITSKKVNSIVGIKGIIKKFGYLLIVALSVLLDKILGDSSAIRTLVIYFFIANEGISILKNWGSDGFTTAKKIK